MDDGFELGVRQHPQQVVQDEEQLGRQHVAVLYLDRTTGELNHTRSGLWFLKRGSPWQSHPALQSDANASLVGDET